MICEHCGVNTGGIHGMLRCIEELKKRVAAAEGKTCEICDSEGCLDMNRPMPDAVCLSCWNSSAIALHLFEGLLRAAQMTLDVFHVIGPWRNSVKLRRRRRRAWRHGLPHGRPRPRAVGQDSGGAALSNPRSSTGAAERRLKSPARVASDDGAPVGAKEAKGGDLWFEATAGDLYDFLLAACFLGLNYGTGYRYLLTR